MEELNLEDLNFGDESTVQLFDETGTPEAKPTEKPEEGGTNPDAEAAAQATADAGGTDDKIKPDGDDTATAGQESVATQSKENQVQSGKTSTNGDGSNSSSPKLNETEQLYSNLAAQFKAKGVLPELDISTIKSMEDIENAIQASVTSRLTSRQQSIEDAQKSGAPISEVAEKVDTIDRLEAIKPEFLEAETSMDFRRTAIIQDFVSKGYGQERAETLAQRSIDAGTDVEDAKFAVTNIIASEKAALAGIIKSAKDKEIDSLNNIKDYISKTPEVIPGIQLNDSQKDELYNQITTDVSANKDNAFMAAQKADPVGSRIKLEALFYLTKGLTDFSVFGNATETKVSNKIENLLRGANFTEEGKVNTSVPDSNSTFGLSDLKDLEIE